MQRFTRYLVVIAAACLFSGCAMCDSSFDYLYPASGGCYGWQADDYARAGSAFGGSGRVSYATSDGGVVITETEGQPTLVQQEEAAADESDADLPSPAPDLSPRQNPNLDDDVPALPPENGAQIDGSDLLAPPDFGTP